MELEEAINKLQEMIGLCTEEPKHITYNEEQAIEVILNYLKRQKKMIELLIKHICDVIDNDDGACLLPFYDSDENLEEKVKQYFEKKAEESNAKS